MISIEIWASGGGTNANKIISYFNNISNINVVSLGCNRKDAGSFKVAEKHGIKSIYWSNRTWESGYIIESLKNRSIDFIVLAGFLKLVPKEVIQEYEGKIINIHPSLLPKYGGKNMYGDYVHQAVIDNKEHKSGISIHEVNEEFDKGKILAQFTTSINSYDGVIQLKNKIQKLEHQNYSPVIHSWIKTKSQ